MGCKCSKDQPKGAKKPVQPAPKTEQKPAAPEPKPAEKPKVPVNEKAIEDQARIEEDAAAKRLLEEEKRKSIVQEAVNDEDLARLEKIASIRQSRYKYAGPTVEGVTVACFPEGILYRITNDEGWYFYNDTLDYELHVAYSFGPESELQSSSGELSKDEDGWFTIKSVVYPLQTLEYFLGTYNGYKSSIICKPLSAQYRANINEEPHARALRAKQELLGLFGDDCTEEQILAQCKEVGLPYVDLTFPPSQDSLYRPRVDGRIVPEASWLRPAEYLSDEVSGNVAAIRGPILPQTVEQGTLGDVWLTCAFAVLAEKPHLVDAIFNAVDPTESSSAAKAGAYYVKLNKNGEWKTVLVDDYLPVVHNVPCFARSTDDASELWVSLLQKAYAKLSGSYAAITGGDAVCALRDLTGCPTYRFDQEWEAAAVANGSSTPVNDFVAKLAHYIDSGYLVGVNTPGNDFSSYLGQQRKADKKAFSEKFKKVGLKLRNMYAIVQVRSFLEEGINLIQVRNAQGSGSEWTGAWSYGSSQWSKFPNIAAACGVDSSSGTAAKKTGAFWMEWSDVSQYFDGGVVCYTPAAAAEVEDLRVKGTFDEAVPSVVLEVTASAPSTVILSLSQKDKRGRSETDPHSTYSALMLSVAQVDEENQNKYVVDKNNTDDPEQPSTDYAFAITRDVSLQYAFAPSSTPYYVIPRVHAPSAHPKEYVLTVQGNAADIQNLNISFKRLDGSCDVYSNSVTFSLGEVQPAFASTQVTRSNGETESNADRSEF